MAAHDSCVDCKGQGYSRCEACVCTKCGLNGKVKCSGCDNGVLPCQLCSATGQVAKKGLIFTRQEECPSCRGAKTIPCNNCKGSRYVTCYSCEGRGRNAQCSQCGTTQKIGCRTCNGSGKVESQWSKSLKNLPVDRLRFEHEKRQREVSTLEIQISRVQRQIDQLQQDWNDAYEEAASSGSRGIHNFDASGYQSGDRALYNEIGNLEKRRSELESEMQAIEQALNTKWS